MKTGPLHGVKLVEFAGIGPAPFAVMLLADMGASVVRIERSAAEWPDVPIVSRGRASMTLDLRDAGDMARAKAVIAAADVLVEGFRPGAMERLGLGPDAMAALNPRLIYGRMTGWGQTGPLASTAGHDINYIALAGMLSAISAPGQSPRAPLNLLGDYGGGGLYLALGIVCALFERERSGQGQTVDAAIVDGAASLLAPIFGMIAAGLLPSAPAAGMLGGDAAIYRTYRCADGGFVAVGPLEPRFRRELAARLELAPEALDGPEAAALLADRFAMRDRDDWARLFEGSDACVAPVLNASEAAVHPHLAERGTLIQGEYGLEPAPAPRLSRTPGAIAATVSAEDRLREWGVAV